MTEPTFSKAKIETAKDAEALASWDRSRDPNEVVLPLSIASGWAYSEKRVFDEVMARRGLHGGDSRLVEIGNEPMFVCAKVYVQPVGAGGIVAFRGTQPTNLISWLADATLQQVAFHAAPPGAPRGYVHGGFYRNIRAVWPEVLEALHAIDPQWIYLTGHSFGGALALLGGALLADYAKAQHPRGYGDLWAKVKGIFTFGQPMTGDAAFAAYYATEVGSRLYRFVYDHDIVPHLPPKTPAWTPVHFGSAFTAASGAKWERDARLSVEHAGILSSNLIGIASWIKDQTGIAPRLSLPYSWADHAPNNYVRTSLPAQEDSGSEFD
jgi:hypothetical protein